jgi:O-antigen/teichoic acid export membrane protein
MSLRDKVIKNTFYHFLAQAFGFLSPFILTPLIIAHIGNTEFGMYAIVLGFIGTFGLLDFSFSASFIKFISEFYNKKESDKLNSVVNTGFFFYLGFTLFICLIVLIFSESILGLINIPPGLQSLARFSLYISLIIFFLATSTTIFVSVLISIQKMYLNSIIGLLINIANFVSTYLLLVYGYGLPGILFSQLGAVAVSVFFNVFLAMKEVPSLKISTSYLSRDSFRSMGKFGLQMQVSRFSAFISEKYDEFLLGYFSNLANVTYFNLAGRVTRLGKFFPLQLFQQVAPVAAELNAREESAKLNELFREATKYLTLFSIPVFVYIMIYADVIIKAWMGDGYGLSAYLLRILAAGQAVNLLISAPGNSIIPNLGIPKYLMYEGIISLAVNLVLSFLLIKYYGIIGAAIGSAISTLIASSYIYISSVRFFKENTLKFAAELYLKPVVFASIACLISYGVFFVITGSNGVNSGRTANIVTLILTGIPSAGIYLTVLWLTKYLNEKDMINLKKLMLVINPLSKKPESK